MIAVYTIAGLAFVYGLYTILDSGITMWQDNKIIIPLTEDEHTLEAMRLAGETVPIERRILTEKPENAQKVKQGCLLYNIATDQYMEINHQKLKILGNTTLDEHDYSWVDIPVGRFLMLQADEYVYNHPMSIGAVWQEIRRCGIDIDNLMFVPCIVYITVDYQTDPHRGYYMEVDHRESFNVYSHRYYCLKAETPE